MTDRLAEIKARHEANRIVVAAHRETGTPVPGNDDIAWLIAEVERLRDGKFTPEEIHNFCHDLPQTVPACEFAAGCAHRQREFYGVAPDADDAERWRYVLEHADHILWDDGSATTNPFNGNREEFTAAVDAARKTT